MADFTREEVVQVVLDGRALERADLLGADLRGAYLSGASLCAGDLRGANLSRADLSEADLRGAYLSGADMRWADLSDASLVGANLTGVDLMQAVYSYGTQMPSESDRPVDVMVGAKCLSGRESDSDGYWERREGLEDYLMFNVSDDRYGDEYLN
jgi:uncharacterized protein YjbI with pentapeptide repeats|tara:strand:- start:432 stop:893 length:462 start_codon:yes stop_codon:yes gene_type:complete